MGAHLSIGVLFGVALTLAREGLAWLIVSRGEVPASTSVNLSTTLGPAHAVSALFVLLPSSMLSTLGVFLFYFLLRVFLRREWLSASAFLLVLGVSATLLTSGSPWVAAPIRLSQYALSLAVLLRFGLLPFAAGLYISNLLIMFPITTQWSAWYAGSAWLALAPVAALAVFAFRASLAGRPLFKGELLDG